MRLHLVTVFCISSLFFVPHPIFNTPTPKPAFDLANTAHAGFTVGKTLDPNLIESAGAATSLGKTMNAGKGAANNADIDLQSLKGSHDISNSQGGTGEDSLVSKTGVDPPKTGSGPTPKNGEAPPELAGLEGMPKTPRWKLVANKLLWPIKLPFKLLNIVMQKITDFRVASSLNTLFKHDPNSLTALKYNEILEKKQKLTRLGKFFRWIKMDERAWMPGMQNTQSVFQTKSKDTLWAKWFDNLRGMRGTKGKTEEMQPLLVKPFVDSTKPLGPTPEAKNLDPLAGAGNVDATKPFGSTPEVIQLDPATQARTLEGNSSPSSKTGLLQKMKNWKGFGSASRGEVPKPQTLDSQPFFKLDDIAPDAKPPGLSSQEDLGDPYLNELAINYRNPSRPSADNPAEVPKPEAPDSQPYYRLDGTSREAEPLPTSLETSPSHLEASSPGASGKTADGVSSSTPRSWKQNAQKRWNQIRKSLPKPFRTSSSRGAANNPEAAGEAADPSVVGGVPSPVGRTVN